MYSSPIQIPVSADPIPREFGHFTNCGIEKKDTSLSGVEWEIPSTEISIFLRMVMFSNNIVIRSSAKEKQTNPSGLQSTIPTTLVDPKASIDSCDGINENDLKQKRANSSGLGTILSATSIGSRSIMCRCNGIAKHVAKSKARWTRRTNKPDLGKNYQARIDHSLVGGYRWRSRKGGELRFQWTERQDLRNKRSTQNRDILRCIGTAADSAAEMHYELGGLEDKIFETTIDMKWDHTPVQWRLLETI